MNRKKAIIFDVDGTLVDRRDAFIRFCNYLIDRYGKDYPFDMPKEALIDYMVEIDENGYGGLESFIPRLNKRWRLPLVIEEFIAERNEVFGGMTTAYPELYEVLDVLKDRYRLGIITNGFSTVQRDKINAVGIAGYFEDIIVSGDLDYEKPDARIFALSCQNLGVSPEEAIYIGDYYPNDIAGAMGAGIMPIWICDDTKEHPEYKGIYVNRLRDILRHL